MIPYIMKKWGKIKHGKKKHRHSDEFTVSSVDRIWKYIRTINYHDWRSSRDENSAACQIFLFCFLWHFTRDLPCQIFLFFCLWHFTRDLLYLCQWAGTEPQQRVRDFCFHFRTCWSLDELWIFRVGSATLNKDGQRNPKPKKLPPRCRHAHSFRILSWSSASRPPLFLPAYCCTSSSKYLTFWKFQSLALEPKILWKRFFAWSFRTHFFFVMPFSYESEHTKLMT